MKESVIDMMYKIVAGDSITIIVDPKISTAMFEPKRRLLLLPTWSDTDPDIANWLRAHEVAHAKWTPPVAYHETIKESITSLVGKRKYPRLMSDLFNIMEDIRIERKMKALLPTMRTTFPIAANKVLERYWMGEPVPTFVERNWHDMQPQDRINLVAKCAKYSDRLSSEERKIYAAAMLAEEFEELIEPTLALYDLVLQTQQQKQEDEPPLQFGAEAPEEGEGEGQEGEGQEGEGQEGEGEGDESQEGEGEGQEGEGQGDSEDGQGEGDEGQEGEGEGSVDGDSSKGVDSSESDSVDAESNDGGDPGGLNESEMMSESRKAFDQLEPDDDPHANFKADRHYVPSQLKLLTPSMGFEQSIEDWFELDAS